MSRKCENEHPELIELCTGCEEEDCDGEPCAAYKAKETLLRMERRAEGSQPYRRDDNPFGPSGHLPLHKGGKTGTKREGSAEEDRAHTQVRPYGSKASCQPVKERRPAILFAELDEAEEFAQNRISLGKYNAAIDALAGLTGDDFFSSSPEIGTANALLLALRIERRERFESLVDWKRIAEG